MYRFLLFAYRSYEEIGGMADLAFKFNMVEELQEAIYGNDEHGWVCGKVIGGDAMNCGRIIKEIMEYAINNMTLEEQKYFRKVMFDAVGDLDEVILLDDKDWR